MRISRISRRTKWMALLPLMYPTTSETAYLGGIAISMCTCRYGLFGRHLRETKRDGRRIRATDSGEYCTDGSASRGRGIAEFDLVLLAALHAGNLAVSRGGLSGGRALPTFGLETDDGRGNIVGMATDSDTGESYRFTGTDRVDGDCSGRVMYTGGFYYDRYVSPNGSSVEFISTDLGAVLSGPSRRISTRAIVR